MQAFLRDDLWAKPCLHQADARAEASDSLVAVPSRITFLVAALISTAQAATFVAISALAFVAHVVCSVINAVVRFDSAYTVTAFFYDSFSKLRGSLFVAIVAALSGAVHTDISRNVQGWLGERISTDWNQFKEAEVYKLAKRIDNARQRRLSSAPAEDCYRMGKSVTCRDAEGKTFSSNVCFDVITNDIKAKVDSMIAEADVRINDPGTTDEQRYEYEQEAIGRISTFVRKKVQRLRSLPVSYLEFADYRMRKAEGLSGRAVKFFDKHAAIVGDLESRRSPGEFDSEAFSQGIRRCREEVQKGFEGPLEALRNRYQALKDAWKANIEDSRASEDNMMSQYNSYARWLTFGSMFLTEEARERYQSEAVTLQSSIMECCKERQQAILSIRKGAFESFVGQQLSCDGYFTKQVRPGGSIVSKINSLASPGIFQSLFRMVGL